MFELRGDSESTALNDDIVRISGRITYEATPLSSSSVVTLRGIDNAIIDIEAVSTTGTKPFYFGPFSVKSPMKSLTVSGEVDNFTTLCRCTATVGTLRLKDLTMRNMTRGFRNEADQSANIAYLQNVVTNNGLQPVLEQFSGVAFGGEPARLCLGLGAELTIASGIVTATSVIHAIDTQSDAATDDLVTINGGEFGDRLTIRAADSARTIVAKDATGNLVLGADRTLDNALDTLELVKRADGKWHQTGFADLGV